MTRRFNEYTKSPQNQKYYIVKYYIFISFNYLLIYRILNSTNLKYFCNIILDKFVYNE